MKKGYSNLNAAEYCVSVTEEEAVTSHAKKADTGAGDSGAAEASGEETAVVGMHNCSVINPTPR